MKIDKEIEIKQRGYVACPESGKPCETAKWACQRIERLEKLLKKERISNWKKLFDK